jgi:hypothetical protein
MPPFWDFDAALARLHNLTLGESVSRARFILTGRQALRYKKYIYALNA